MFQESHRPKGRIQAVENGTLWQLHDDQGALAFGDTPIDLPSENWAQAITDEWKPRPKIKPDSRRDSFNLKPDRPATQVARLALQGIPIEPAKYHQQLLNYLATDTILFWQKNPSSLMQAQETHWQPVLEWIAQSFGDCPEPCFGLQPAQVSENLNAALKEWLEKRNSYSLAGMVFLTGITGSIMLSVALSMRYIDADAAYNAACLEALYQREHWGADTEGDARLERVRTSCLLAADFLQTELD